MVSNQLYIIGIMDLVSQEPLPSRKIGISGKGNSNVFSRVRELNSSKSGTLLPVHCYPVRAWNIFDSQHTPISAHPIEQRLHDLFKSMTSHYIRGEWFSDDVTDNGESETERETERTLAMFQSLGFIIEEVDVSIDNIKSLNKNTIVDSDEKMVQDIVEANKYKFKYTMLTDAINEFTVNDVEYTSKQLAEFCLNLYPELNHKKGGLRQIAAEIGPNYRNKLKEDFGLEYVKLSPRKAVFIFNKISEQSA